jgi:SAM-dependent methyltransferase
MQYEPIKHSIDSVISRNIHFKKIFFKLLDLHLLRTWHVHKEIRKIAKKKKEGMKILDAGCGFGQYSWFCARKFKRSEIKGIDISQSHVDRANTFFKKAGLANIECVQADLTQFVEKEKYDLIFSVDVMEHILEDQQVFNNFCNSLKKGGLLLVSTPSNQGGSDVHDHASEDSFIDEHVRDGYSMEDIDKKLRQAGFSLIESRYTYGKPGKISWKLSMKIPISLLNTSKAFFLLLPLYFLISYPLILLLNCMDLNGNHKSGTGLLVKATK